MDDQNVKDRRLTNVVILDKNTYESVRLMLISSDEADRMMGYLTLESVDQEKSLVYTLFLRKECTFSRELEWKTHSPNTLRYHDSLKVSTLSHKSIYTVLKETKNVEFLNFYLYKLSSYIKSVFFDDYNDNLIENVEIVFKYKE